MVSEVPLAVGGKLTVDEVVVFVGDVVVPVVHLVQKAVVALLPDPLLSFPSLSTNSTSFTSMAFYWLMTECRSRAYAILICLSLSSSSSSLSLSSVSTPPDHMLGQIRFILCMHMQLYPI